MSDNLEEFINDWLDTWTGNQPDELLRYYHKEIFYLDPANPNGIYGQENLKEYLKKLLGHNPNWTWKAKEVIPTKKGCVLKWEAQIPIADDIITTEGLDIIEIKEQKIVRNEVFFDRSAWFKKLGK